MDRSLSLNTSLSQERGFVSEDENERQTTGKRAQQTRWVLFDGRGVKREGLFRVQVEVTVDETLGHEGVGGSLTQQRRKHTGVAKEI